jgi:hypothetical protein
MIVDAGGGERDIAVDTAILSGMRKVAEPAAFLNERLMRDLRPTLFLAQLPNLLAGNFSLVHGVVGSSRTFMGEEGAGVDAVRVAQALIAAGQSELTLVGGSYHGPRWDVLFSFELTNSALKGKFAPVWDRGPQGGIAFATMGAFLVLESREHAQARGARPRGRISEVYYSDRNLRKPGDIEASLRRQFAAVALASSTPTQPSSPALPGSSRRLRRSWACSRFGLPSATPGLISDTGSILSSRRISASPPPHSSTASSSHRPEAETAAQVRHRCPRSWSPASAIGAAKGSRW